MGSSSHIEAVEHSSPLHYYSSPLHYSGLQHTNKLNQLEGMLASKLTGRREGVKSLVHSA